MTLITRFLSSRPPAVVVMALALEVPLVVVAASVHAVALRIPMVLTMDLTTVLIMVLTDLIHTLP